MSVGCRDVCESSSVPRPCVGHVCVVWLVGFIKGSVTELDGGGQPNDSIEWLNGFDNPRRRRTHNRRRTGGI